MQPTINTEFVNGMKRDRSMVEVMSDYHEQTGRQTDREINKQIDR